MTPFWKKDKDRELPPDFLDQASGDRRAEGRERSAPPAQRRATPPPDAPAGEPRREPTWRETGENAPAPPSRPYPTRPKRVSNAEARRMAQPETRPDAPRTTPTPKPARAASPVSRPTVEEKPVQQSRESIPNPERTRTLNDIPEPEATSPAKPRAWQATIPVDREEANAGASDSDSLLSFATSAPPPPPPSSSRRRKQPESGVDKPAEPNVTPPVAKSSHAAQDPAKRSISSVTPAASAAVPESKARAAEAVPRQPTPDAGTLPTPKPAQQAKPAPVTAERDVDGDDASSDPPELTIPIEWDEASKYDNPYRPGGGGESVEAVLQRGGRTRRTSYAEYAMQETVEATSAVLDESEELTHEPHHATARPDLPMDDADDDWVEETGGHDEDADLAFADEPAWMQDDMAADPSSEQDGSPSPGAGFNRFSLDETASDVDEGAGEREALWVEPGTGDAAPTPASPSSPTQDDFGDEEATWEGEGNPWENTDEQVRYGARPNPRVSTTLFNFGDASEDAPADDDEHVDSDDYDDEAITEDDHAVVDSPEPPAPAANRGYHYQTPGLPGDQPEPEPHDESPEAMWREEEPSNFETTGLNASASAPLPPQVDPVYGDHEHDDVTAPPPPADTGGGFDGGDFDNGNGHGFGNGHDDGYGDDYGDGYGDEYGDGTDQSQDPPQPQEQVIVVEDEDGHAHKTLYMNGDVDEYAEEYYDEDDEDYEDEIPEEEEPDEVAKAEAGLPLAGHTNERNGWGYTFVIATLFTMFGSITIATYFVVMNTNASIPNIMVNVSVFALLFFILILFNRYFVLIFLSFLHHVRIKDFEVSKEDFEPLKATILVPAYNEGVVIESSIESLLKLNYPNYEILVINDGSSDDTLEKAKLWEGVHDTAEVRVLTQRNKGKAAALNHGAAMARGDVVVCMDGDSRLTPDTLGAGMRYFDDPEVGGVAGNVKVVNRRNVLTRLQALEYVEGLNLVRRAQAYLNAVNIVPGPIGLFRRDILLQVGGWDTDTFAEDCDLTLKILTSGYKIEYEPYAISETEAPESLIPLLKQRYRWTRGILQSMRKHRSFLINPDAGWRVVITMWQMVLEGILWPLMNILANMMFMLVAFLFGMSPLLVLWWVQLTILDTIAALHALAIEREDLTLVPYAVIYRLIFIQIVDVTKMLATIEELLGIKMGWGKLERKGRLT